MQTQTGPTLDSEWTVTVACNRGQTVLGGGFATPTQTPFQVVRSYPSDGTSWTVVVISGDNPSNTGYAGVWAVCATTN